ncbi:MAG: 5-(carboxyamino)imidazole ribonucleotide synthase [Gemmatimonadota bacterium]
MRVGILGGGQLGQMLALAGRPLGLTFRFLEPAANPPAAELGEIVQAPYDDPAALERFADGLSVVTYEFENVPAASTHFLAERLPVRPGPAALAVGQDRLTERRGLAAVGIPVSEYRAVDSTADLRAALDALGLPLVLKTRTLGYDGKGQFVLRSADDAGPAWEAVQGRSCIAERFVPFDRELSIVAVRGLDGEFAHYPLVQNRHEQGILHETVAPAPDLTPSLEQRARSYALDLMERLDYVGVIAIELFQIGDTLLANEVAPRVHNSGHWTQDGSVTSQFENHLRAITGMPLGSTAPTGRTVMTNLIGAVGDVRGMLAEAGAHVHLYGKAPRPGRKLGHVNRVEPGA